MPYCQSPACSSVHPSTPFSLPPSPCHLKDQDRRRVSEPEETAVYNLGGADEPSSHTIEHAASVEAGTEGDVEGIAAHQVHGAFEVTEDEESLQQQRIEGEEGEQQDEEDRKEEVRHCDCRGEGLIGVASRAQGGMCSRGGLGVRLSGVFRGSAGQGRQEGGGSGWLPHAPIA